MTSIGIKTLTIKNWLQPDVISGLFTRLSLNDGHAYLMTAEDWVAQFLTPKLLELVPEEVKILFEVARGSLAYGYFFYPLYALAGEQLFRVGEAAITAKFLSEGGSDPQRSFIRKLEYLQNANIITEAQFAEWDIIRKFRNEVSHPQRQNIFTPGQIAGILNHVANTINELFA